jgi:hypothetical protein
MLSSRKEMLKATYDYLLAIKEIQTLSHRTPAFLITGKLKQQATVLEKQNVKAKVKSQRTIDCQVIDVLISSL